MSYQVIARKWRPQTFDDIVGQEHVTTTLKNSIASGRIGHAFLFTGIRGIGKTTAARVLAKALDCESGPTQEPCNHCVACTEITAGTSLDVHEIDGASNRGIDSIRELREGVAYTPARDRFKIYIIDEVHMLTTEAFNALLKTLEEPPGHVVFIFATTELHKVPPTIASRCQVFEFKRIPVPLLVSRLQKIVSAEGVSISEDALRLIAREADGSLRDACSLTDQVISFASGPVEAGEVAEILRTGDRAILHRTLSSIVAEDAADALAALQEVVDRGTPPRQFLRDLARFASECLKASLMGADAVRETGLTEAEIAQMTALASAHAPEYLATLLHLLVTAADRAADSRSPDLLAQAALVKASRLASLSSVEGMIGRLEAIAAGAPLPPAAPDEAPRRPAAPAQRAPAPSPAIAPQAPSRAPSGSASAAVDRLSKVTQAVPRPGTPPVRAATPQPAPKPPVDTTADKLMKHPVVDRALSVFGGEVEGVRGEKERE
jgi:DNA polymerase-3 subunit gamma/tau